MLGADTVGSTTCDWPLWEEAEREGVGVAALGVAAVGGEGLVWGCCVEVASGLLSSGG